VDRTGLAQFLRRRREAIRPDDVGLPAGARRRTPGLRREEVAQLTGMSVDYYNRLEQARAPQPSPQILRPLARSLRLSDDERDHLFRLAGHAPPERTRRSSHVRPALLHVLDRLDDCAAFVCDDLDVLLAQNRLARLLMGDTVGDVGWEASTTWTWFTRPALRSRIPIEDHGHHSRVRVADLRATWSRRRGDQDVETVVARLLATSPEFADLWNEHEVAVRRGDTKRFLHPAVGVLQVDCEVLATSDEGQRLVILSARPGTDDADRLRLIGVLGDDRADAGSAHDAALSAGAGGSRAPR
jgi:transcriptional regulator with XRE-family HTH domain